MKSNEVVVFAVSCKKNKNSRIEACKKTWATDLVSKGVRVLFVVGQPDQQLDFVIQEDILYVKCGDGYKDLPAKTRMLAQFFVENCLDKKHLFKCDDDTYIHVSNFLEYEIEGAFVGSRISENIPSGGAGYFLNHDAAEKVAYSDLSRGAEDVEVGKVLDNHNIKLINNNSRMSGWPQTALGWSQSPEWRGKPGGWMGDVIPPYEPVKNYITSHLLRLPPQTMYDFHEMIVKGEKLANQ